MSVPSLTAALGAFSRFLKDMPGLSAGSGNRLSETKLTWT